LLRPQDWLRDFADYYDIMPWEGDERDISGNDILLRGVPDLQWKDTDNGFVLTALTVSRLPRTLSSLIFSCGLVACNSPNSSHKRSTCSFAFTRTFHMFLEGHATLMSAAAEDLT
jgi:hypothetical protein